MDKSEEVSELNRRVRIAYEQMKRHEDEPSGRLYNLWRDKYNQANDELTKFIESGEKEVTPVEVEEVMDEDDFIHAGIAARERRKVSLRKTAEEQAREWIDTNPDWVDAFTDFVNGKRK